MVYFRKYLIEKVNKMKKRLISFALLSSVFLAGCQTNDPEEDLEASAEETTEEVAENTEEVVEEEEVAEEVDYLYEIHPEIFSVVPIDAEEVGDEKLVLLTFDDAPYGNSLEIADALDEQGVSAIFFVNGMYMEDEEGFEVVQELHERGFEIGNHSHTHLNLGEHPEDVQKEEILKTNEIIEEATGESPRFFRAPHGVMTDYSKTLLTELGMTWMNWSFGYDWQTEYQDAAALTEITLNTPYLGDGANILMHDREWTAAATPDILQGLDELGFTMVDPKLIVNHQALE